jgi:hypothetical protein
MIKLSDKVAYPALRSDQQRKSKQVSIHDTHTGERERMMMMMMLLLDMPLSMISR